MTYQIDIQNESDGGPPENDVGPGFGKISEKTTLTTVLQK